MTNAALIESILFFEGGTMSVKNLSKATHLNADEVRDALTELRSGLSGRGLQLVSNGDTVGLATAPEAHSVIEALRRDELEGPVGRAGLETLAVILYQGQVSRADIEYIRGVNASSILRSLLIRGLVERIESPKDKRSFLYRATAELPAYLGVGQIKDLPDYAKIRSELDAVYADRPSEPEEIAAS